GSEYLITAGTSGCLFVFAGESLTAITDKLTSTMFTDGKTNSAIREFTAKGTSVECDGQGRFNLPTNLKSYAKIDKDIYVIGAGNKVEIWSKEVWDKHNEASIDLDTMFDKLAELGV
ncbi:MAG: cell division/cell wall cluster transcriptional repressor MraZ, partial [Clostridia bacterium]